ncbi:FecR domain-containing protein [Chryseolinea sp. T2]|uniref:FecR family protein n=1 Tax=Chryseolinea sp. T2 TaxID=3129255 RepID=UPI003077CAB4
MKKDFLSYTATDFARDADFLKWVKYPSENPAITAFWESWLKENPSKREQVEDARQLIFAILEYNYRPSDETQAEIWSKIRTTLHIDNQPVEVKETERKTRTLFWVKIAAAASFLVVATFGTTYFLAGRNTELPMALEAKPVFIKEENRGTSPRTVVLKDGTSIILQPQSFIQVPKDFIGDQREVYLTGEAFFEVKRDPTRPFLVHTNEIVTRVLGTSFNVKGFENENVTVRVKTGKVSVFKAKDKEKATGDDDAVVEGVVLSPNQQVVYDRVKMSLSKSLIEDPVMLGTKPRYHFEFKDEPVINVFKEIEEAYGVHIVYDAEVLANCKLNASISDVPLYDKLRLICIAINAQYELLDSQIVVYGKGCDKPD